MTGPEHYKRAEQLVDSVDEAMTGDDPTATDNMDVLNAALAAAQVHATLALAAATVVPVLQDWDGLPHGREWSRVA